MKDYRVYAIYKGDTFLFEGTAKECAEYFGVKEKTVWFWRTPTNFKRGKKNRKIAISIDEE